MVKVKKLPPAGGPPPMVMAAINVIKAHMEEYGWAEAVIWSDGSTQFHLLPQTRPEQLYDRMI